MDTAIEARAGTVAGIEGGEGYVGAAQLLALSHALEAPVSDFFKDLPPAPSGNPVKSLEAERIDEAESFLVAYFKIAEADVRRDILSLIKAAGEDNKGD